MPRGQLLSSAGPGDYFAKTTNRPFICAARPSLSVPSFRAIGHLSLPRPAIYLCQYCAPGSFHWNHSVIFSSDDDMKPFLFPRGKMGSREILFYFFSPRPARSSRGKKMGAGSGPIGGRIGPNRAQKEYGNHVKGKENIYLIAF